MKYPLKRTALAAALLSALSAPAWADMSVEARLKAMESRLNALEAENQALKGQLQSTEQKVTATTAQIEEVSRTASAGGASWAENTRIGGYGELHYNNLDGEGGASGKDEFDLHRFVL
ncbi:MAG: porin, partial [Thiobacillus sp.]